LQDCRIAGLQHGEAKSLRYFLFCNPAIPQSCNFSLLT